MALIDALLAAHWVVHYVGSSSGIERGLIAPMGIAFHGIATGKLRRYFSWQNFIDPLYILCGFCQSLWLCMRLRPDVVFSKGGFVAVPLVTAAWLLRIPVISHESDTTPGLANKLCFPFCRWICVNFPQTTEHLPAGKVLVTGSPVRSGLLQGDAGRARQEFGLAIDKPVLLVFGGSLGANVINQAVRQNLAALLSEFQVVHVVGAGNLSPALADMPGYIQRDYINEGFGDVLALAELVIARAGANTIYELLITRTPHILVPLSAAASRGDQLINAKIFADAGFSEVITESELTHERLLRCIQQTYARRELIQQRLASFDIKDSVAIIIDLIKRAADRAE
ncbi:MAG: UDP-N-acetylglucosamine--N-acetylmuramyl-(pentapeptide) pyrophosphoryl-undecaprenol N-acetylglucosamine transferase [Candidatus Pseudothioglobus sp.]|jgi:UDP-N-acetylglucosamine--N-acetylmuramyl-(pentapeptide) pyrophosphoryl-undecaprenol N-acetylglucosamine transferase